MPPKMLSEKEKDTILKQISKLNAKKNNAFMQAQNINDLIKDLANEQVRSQFISGYRVVNRERFESILDEIQDLELELNPDYKPNYEPLCAFDTLLANILVAVDKLNFENSDKPAYKDKSDQTIKLLDNIKFSTNLPPLKINNFSGNIQDWPRFRDLFTSIVIKNPRLSHIEKLNYLMTSVSDRAHDIIKNFPISDDNFEPAWQSLKERYDSDRVLACYYFEEITKPITIPSKPTVESLQHFLTKINDSVTGLKNMKLNSLLDFILFSLALKQLDPITRKDFEAKNKDQAFPSFDSLINFVKSECRLIEISVATTSDNTPSVDKNKNNNIRSTTKSTTSINNSRKQSVLTTNNYSAMPQKYNNRNIKCPLCGLEHHLYICSQFHALTVSERHNLVRKYSLCYNCLGSHSTKNCRSYRNCPVPHCNRRHHRLLHFENSKQQQNTAVTQANNNMSTNHVEPTASNYKISNYIPPASLSTSYVTATPPVNTVPAQYSPITSVYENPSTSMFQTSNPHVLTTIPYKNKSSIILLGTACALIKNKNGKFIKLRLIVDCASTATFITKRLVDRLGLNINTNIQNLCGLSSSSVGKSLGSVKGTIKPLHSTTPQLTTEMLVIDNILHNVPSIDLPASIANYFKNITLADPEFYRSQPCDLLLGLDLFPSILTNQTPPHPNTDIGMLSTIFGFIILGPLPVEQLSCLYNKNHNKIFTFMTLTSDNVKDNDVELHKQVSRFWEVENVKSAHHTDPSDKYCEQHFIKTHRRNCEGRYIVQMPFSVSPTQLVFPQSRDVALQRFYSLETRFKNNPQLKKVCVDFLEEYKRLGHMKKANRPGKYFIPYFCIFSPHSPTTPVRVVFDGSAKKSHLSLNEVLLPGPKLQHDVPDVLLNFRIYRYAFTCDISKMYRQILIDESQTEFLHIYFREDQSNPIEEYELLTVTYGLTPSSFLSHRCLLQLTQDEGKPYPLAVSALREDSCVDDILSGCSSLSDLFELKNQLCSLLSKGGFSLNKWSSNSEEFLSELKNNNFLNQTPLVIRSTDDHSIKVLGLGWNPQIDCFFFTIDAPPLSSTYSKRQVLSCIAKIYDPLGFVSPTIFLLKCILKEIWISGVGWDDSIPPSISEKWQQCLSELADLKKLKIPRCLFPHKSTSFQLLGFCDGSLKGSAAALYLRVEYFNSNVQVFLIKSKTRVSPAKVQTIPRLELISALLLSELVVSIRPFLNKILFSDKELYLFTDSTIVLSWLRKPPYLLKLFVSNRVSAILENTQISHWHHIRTDLNVSDIASRGLTPRQLLNNKEWFDGPPWIYRPINEWPISTLNEVPENNLPETKTILLINLNFSFTIPLAPSELMPRYSSFGKLQRIVGYVIRFINNLKLSTLKRYSECNSGTTLTISELNNALTACIKSDQLSYFSFQIKTLSTGMPCSGNIQRLSPFIDNHGVIRVGGRLKESNLTFNEKHPILLHNKSQFTNLIINYYHRLYLHAGPRTLCALLAKYFWILNSRSVVRFIIHKCITCARFKATTYAPIMGNLPSNRVTPSRPFLNCGVDLAGPFVIKESLRRNAKTYKAYFALFICFSVKAIHIEPLNSLTADAFIAVLHRFISRRGRPANIYCDQATNFKGAARQLAEIVTFLRSSNLSSLLHETLNPLGITFTFNCPKAPFMAGLAESNIKNVKNHMIRTIGQQILTYEEFFTILTRVEAILNSRPLCDISSSPDDIKCLTPAHFLINDSLQALPEECVDDININRLSRWQVVSQINQNLWKRWEREYLHTLQNKNKWFTPQSNIKLGQLVWIKEDNSHPLAYPLGRIVSIHPGKDSVVRVATVKTASSTYVRPTRKLAPLPVQ